MNWFESLISLLYSVLLLNVFNETIYHQLDDHQQILQSIANGHRTAFRQLYALYSEKVYNTALSYAKNVEDAEEITQDIFAKIHQNAAKFQGKSSVSTWVYRITVNTSLNHLRRKKRFSFLKFREPSIDIPNFEHPGVLLEHKENAQTLFRVMDKLPNSQKTAFILSYIEELPRKEVANIMEVSLKAVESLLQRAKQKMRLELGKIHPNRRKRKK